MPRNTARGMKTQTRTLIHAATTYSTANHLRIRHLPHHQRHGMRQCAGPTGAGHFQQHGLPERPELQIPRYEIEHLTPISDTIGGPGYHNSLRTREMVLIINVLLQTLGPLCGTIFALP